MPPAMTEVPSAAIEQERAAALKFLEGGEAIIFAIRPSLWFMPLVSGPLALGATFLAVALYFGGPRLSLELPPYALWMLWVIAVMGRLFFAGIQWMGRLYVLTNRRVITVCGLTRFQVRQCPLAKVRGVETSTGPAEKLLGLGTLSFRVCDGQEGVGPWANLSRPAKVRQEIEQAIRRCGG